MRTGASNRKLEAFAALALFPAAYASHCIEIYVLNSAEFFFQWWLPPAMWAFSFLIGIPLIVGRSEKFRVAVTTILVHVNLLVYLAWAWPWGDEKGWLCPTTFLAPLFCVMFWQVRRDVAWAKRAVWAAALLIAISSTGKDAYHVAGILAKQVRITKMRVHVTPPPPPPSRPLAGPIVHVVLDMFSGKIFEEPDLYATSFIKEENAGIYFPHAVANAHFTRESLAQIMRGQFVKKKTDPTVLQLAYQNGFRVYVHSERKEGVEDCAEYAEVCVDTFTLMSQELKEFAREIEQPFWRLMYAFFIRVNEPVLEGKVRLWTTIRLDHYRTRLGRENLNASVILFNRFLDRLATSPTRSYHYLHINLPHPPNLLNAECQVIGAPTEIVQDTFLKDQPGYLAQAECANKLVKRLLGRLKELKKFDDALIVIHGDHGTGVGYLNFSSKVHHPYRNPRLNLQAEVERRARPLLWIKPPHHHGRETRQGNAQLLDVGKLLREPFAPPEQTGFFSKHFLNASAPRPVPLLVVYRKAKIYLRRDLDGVWRDSSAQDLKALLGQDY